MKPEQQIQVFEQNTDNLISEELLLKKLKSGNPLKIKFGIDPTSTDLHLGHVVLLNKLKQLQKLGHQIHIIIGDTTATIGDPTGKNQKRKQLTFEEVTDNANIILEQICKVLDPSTFQIHFNSQWFKNFQLKDLLNILSKVTIQQVTERKDFKQRIENEEPLFLNEIFYPLIQGFDSVEINCDVEIGGSDQLLNILMGRNLQSKFNQNPQIVLTLPILEGTDGFEKMSKTLNNHISLRLTPADFFGKIMSIPDILILKFFNLLVLSDNNLNLIKIQSLFQKNPMLAKKFLGELLIEQIFKISAQPIIKDFENKFSKKDFEKVELPIHNFNKNTDQRLINLVFNTGAVNSLTQARNLIKQGAISINQQKIQDLEHKISNQKDFILKIGKHQFFKIKVE